MLKTGGSATGWMMLAGAALLVLGCGGGSPKGKPGSDAGTDLSDDLAPPVDEAVESSPEVDAGGGDGSNTDVAVQIVETFGCFAKSGDDLDILDDGTPAPMVTSAPWRAACGGDWISTNVNGYTLPTTPATAVMTRRFAIGSLISDRATLTVTFEADDAVELVLNGQSIATCTPPDSAVGECQQSCHMATFPRDVLAPAGQPNVLQVKMINLYNAQAGGGNLGWTGVSYSICAEGE